MSKINYLKTISINLFISIKTLNKFHINFFYKFNLPQLSIIKSIK